jgi:NADH dehydrogenase
LIEYEYHDKGAIATVGKRKAVVELLPKFSFQVVWLGYMWMFVHLVLILSVRTNCPFCQLDV